MTSEKKSIPPFLAIIFIVAILSVLFLLERKGILHSNKVDFYTFLGLVGSGGVLAYNSYLLRCRIDVERDRKEIQEKGRLDERFKVGVEFLKEKDTSVAGVYIIYETYKLDKIQYENIIYDIFKGIINKGTDKDTINTVIKLLGTKKTREKLNYKKKNNEEEVNAIDISQVNFSGMDLRYLDLSEADLNKALFDNTAMEGVNLSDAELPHSVKFTPAHFNMQHCKLRRIKLGSAGRLDGLNLTDSDFTGADFSYGSLTNCILKGCILKGAIFSQAKGLTYEQLSQAITLYGCHGIPTDIEKKLKTEKSELFIKPKEGTNGKS